MGTACVPLSPCLTTVVKVFGATIGCGVPQYIVLFSFDLIRVLFISLISSEVFAVQSCDEFSNARHSFYVFLFCGCILYLFKHNSSTRSYYLIDHTGTPTTWGKWAPAVVNFDRAFSDERGLQSLQMLAYIAAACVILACSLLSLFRSVQYHGFSSRRIVFFLGVFSYFTRFATS